MQEYQSSEAPDNAAAQVHEGEAAQAHEGYDASAAAEGFEPSDPLVNLAAKLDEAIEAPAAASLEASPQAAAPEASPEASASAWLQSVPEQHRAAATAVLQEREQLSQQLQGLRETFAASGMNAQQLAELLDYGRLMMSGEADNMRAALQMLDAHRAYICQQLGVESAAIDPIAAHDDLKKAVDEFNITREHALEIARARAAEQAKGRAAAQAAEQAAQQAAAQQQAQQHQQLVSQSSAAVDRYLGSRAHEADHAAKMAALGEFFRNPQNIAQFVQTYHPNQWAATVAMMYDQMRPAAAPAHSPTPLSRHAAAAALSPKGGAGTWQPQPAAEIDRLSQRLSTLGI